MTLPSPPTTELDLFLTGSLFFDIVFTGLPDEPRPGTEVWAEGMGSVPGGVANLAVAAARLGLRTGLAAGFGDDAYGIWTRALLETQEGIDLSRSRTFAKWHSAVTVSLARAGDRSMVTHGHPIPISQRELIGTPPTSRALLVELAQQDDDEPWWVPQVPRQGKVFAAVGWDPTQQWDPSTLGNLELCHAFLPNDVEAMAYTRTESAGAALKALSSRVPLVVVTQGARGAMAIDEVTGEQAEVPSLAVDAVDPTGAGDVFSAGMVLGTLSDWPLRQRLLFSTLVAALAVKHFGGSLAAPGWGDIADWWDMAKSRARDNEACREIARRYGFLEDIIPLHALHVVRRAEATFGLLTEADAQFRAHRKSGRRT